MSQILGLLASHLSWALGVEECRDPRICDQLWAERMRLLSGREDSQHSLADVAVTYRGVHATLLPLYTASQTCSSLCLCLLEYHQNSAQHHLQVAAAFFTSGTVPDEGVHSNMQVGFDPL